MKKLLLILIAFISLNSFAQTQRQIDSTMLANGATCLLLDFDGYLLLAGSQWNNVSNVSLTASSISGNTASMDSVVDRVRESYVGFGSVVTRDSTLYAIAPVGKRIRIVYTPVTSGLYSGSLLGTTPLAALYNNGAIESPSLVNDNLATTALLRGRTGAHEAGHQFALSHQTTTGSGSGETGIRPLLNSTISQTISMELWWHGTNDLSQDQDEMSILENGIGNYYGMGAGLNDVGNSFNEAKYLRKDQTANNFIGLRDSDYYSIEIPSTQMVTISASPLSFGASNFDATLDIALDLYDESHNLIVSSSNTTTLNASISQSLGEGIYFIKVRGDRGNANNPTGYGFMGHYYLSYTY